MTDTLRRVAMRRPGDELLNADAAVWHYGPEFDPTRISGQHLSFSELLLSNGVEILWMDDDDLGIADSVFTYDASLMTPEGAILMSPGKRQRAGEQELHRAFYAARNVPVIGEIAGEGRAEAGDTLWLDKDILAVGRGFRTNRCGIEQLRTLLTSINVTVYEFDLPVYRGKAACLHLMSLVSIVDTKTALVCTPLLPVGLWELMHNLGFDLVDAPYAEFEESNTLSTNVLAISPGQCVMIDGYPETRSNLESSGIGVQVFDGNALCIGCEGGPTCLTRPVHRG
jgi:dimethylargininase